MITVVSFLDRLAPGLYLLLAAAFIWNVWKARRTSRQYRAMYFELEREVMRLRRVNALTVLVLVGLSALILLGIQLSVLPFLRQVQDIQAIQQEVALVMDGAFATNTPRSPDEAALKSRLWWQRLRQHRLLLARSSRMPQTHRAVPILAPL
jgi:hypothetical protein